MITIIDYGVGNLASIQNIIKKVGGTSIVTKDVTQIEKAEKLLLPGVGHFDACASKLKESGVVNLLEKKVFEDKTPIMGICVGMQLLFKGSEEGKESGLNWLDGHCIKFDETKVAGLKIPHMGWTDIQIKKESPIFKEMHQEPRYYFVHSYHAVVNNSDDILVTATHGYEFVGGVQKQNILGFQFHPEKSHKFGMKLFENFIKYY